MNITNPPVSKNRIVRALPEAVSGGSVLNSNRSALAAGESNTTVADHQFFYTLRMPSDFESLVSATIRFASAQTGDARLGASSLMAEDGQNVNGTQEFLAEATVPVTANLMATLDVSSIFSVLAALDSVGFIFTRHGTDAADTITQMFVFDLVLEYN